LNFAADCFRANRIGIEMKSLFICLLMASIVLAAYHGSPAAMARRLLLSR
jgi:hypothetical protein